MNLACVKHSGNTSCPRCRLNLRQNLQTIKHSNILVQALLSEITEAGDDCQWYGPCYIIPAVRAEGKLLIKVCE